MTSQNEVFLLDANVFIEPKNRFYPFDVFPGYWAFLLQELGGEHVKSIMHVYDELMGHEDDLSDWTKKLGRKRFEDCANDATVCSLPRSGLLCALLGGYRQKAEASWCHRGVSEGWGCRSLARSAGFCLRRDACDNGGITPAEANQSLTC